MDKIIRKVLSGDEAKAFLHTTTKGFKKFTGFGKEVAGVAGYFQSDVYPTITIGFDFTNGEEVFVEDFADIEEAKKYANGEVALTMNKELL